ncbi:MAG: nucleoside triphosphate pyrophosphohydrolase family protein [Deltaproteobacteria bacterium]|nr:nucleoside triphosphate pyrophosphohydrolase family protein [Deltaproteobacteria bacterium]
MTGQFGSKQMEADYASSFVRYQQLVRATDQLGTNDLSVAVLGLFGEVGSAIAVVKKRARDGDTFSAYGAGLAEEIGDVQWYLTCVANRSRLDLSELAQRVSRDLSDWDEVERGFGSWGDVQGQVRDADRATQLAAMAELGEAAGALVGDLHRGQLSNNRDRLSGHLVDVLRGLIHFAAAVDIDLQVTAEQNASKVLGRWPIKMEYPPLADEALGKYERLPRTFRIFVEEVTVGSKTYVMQSYGGIVVGDRLTDNKAEADDYRFHDVFHVAYAVHLGWSPVLRSLLRVKRRSLPNIDENEDGARAILVEEGVSTFVFGRALACNLFEGADRVDTDLLKLIQEFVRGFEPDKCGLWQWERAILDGFAVFRQLRANRSGIIVADLDAHTLSFERAGTVG